MKQLLTGLLFLTTAHASQALANIPFDEVKHAHNVFATGSGRAVLSYDYSPYLEWTLKSSGKYFPLDVAPVLSGKLQGGIRNPAVQGINENSFLDQAKEFAQVVNARNKDGRVALTITGKTVDQAYKDAVAETHVVEVLVSTLINKPLADFQLNAETVAGLAEKIDIDHYHFQIPGTFVQQVLEVDHSGLKIVQPGRNYLLSVFDLREYGCAVMKDGIRDYFSKAEDKDRLKNESIYLISQLDLNQASDIAAAEAYFGKRPQAVIMQQAIYADHLIRAAKTVFAFYPEGNKTRVVLLSTLAMKSKFFTSLKGKVIRQYLLDGINGGLIGGVIAAKDGLDNLLAGANADVKKKNECNRGLALGLIGYTKSLFSQFVKQ
jgi:hypothetical protein